MHSITLTDLLARVVMEHAMAVERLKIADEREFKHLQGQVVALQMVLDLPEQMQIEAEMDQLQPD